MVHRCHFVTFYEYIPSMRLTKRCHYYSEQEDIGCTTGVWHPLAAEKLIVLNITLSDDKDIFEKGQIRLDRREACGEQRPG